MKFKTDENLPDELASDLAASGHDCETVAQESLTGAPDDHLLTAAHREGRVLLTLDKGIANVQVHCCPAISRRESTGCRCRANRSGSRSARRPVKWAFFQKGSR